MPNLYLDRAAGLWRAAAAGPTQPLVLEQKISLGEVRGRIDHLAIDLARERLFIAELGNNSLGVVDLAAGKLLRRIGGLDEPQGVAYDPATDTVFVADGGDGLVHRFKGADLTPLDPIRLGGDADNSASTPRRAWWSATATAHSPLSTPRPASRRLRSACPAIPSSFSSSAVGRESSSTCRTRIRSPSWIGRKVQQMASWGLADAGANFPMALDEADGRLVVGYREPALLAVFDTRSGTPVARLSACGDTDDVFFDAKRQRVYLSCGAGFLDVIQQHGDTYEELARIPTISGARTALFVPERDRLYLAVRASGSEGAAVWVFRPAS